MALGLALPVAAQAAVINFDFTGRLVVADAYGNILINQGQTYTDIAASLAYDTVSGIGSSDLSLTMSDPFLGVPATFHDISMTRQGTSNLITGGVQVDWSGNFNMPLHIEWDGAGLFNAIGIGLQAGDIISGTNLYRDGIGSGGNGDGIGDPGEWLANVLSATPYSDTLPGQVTPQGPAPLAATSGSLGLGAGTPFPGIRGYFDIGSGNSMHVTSVSSVPVPAAVWLFGSGLLGLIGAARRKRA